MANIGRVLLIPKGDYSGSAIYNKLDWVRDNGAAWVCKLDETQGIAPPTLPTTSNDNWQLLSADGAVSGSVAWSAVTSKPFSTLDSDDFEVDANEVLKLKNGGSSTLGGLSDVDLTTPSDGQVLTYDYANSEWVNANKPTVDQTYNQSSANAQSGTAVAGAIAGKADTSALDSWTAAATCQTVGGNVVVVFDNLTDGLGYDLYATAGAFVTYTNVVQSTGTNAGTIKLTYTLNGATSGVNQFMLRILK